MKHNQKENIAILDELIQNRPCYFTGDGKCDIPGHNAKYLTI